jgi:hypothetical protein
LSLLLTRASLLPTENPNLSDSSDTCCVGVQSISETSEKDVSAMPECFGPTFNGIRRVDVPAVEVVGSRCLGVLVFPHEDKRGVKRSGKPLSIWEWSRDPFGFR